MADQNEPRHEDPQELSAEALDAVCGGFGDQPGLNGGDMIQGVRVLQKKSQPNTTGFAPEDGNIS